MNDEEMISRREADAKIDGLKNQIDGLVDLVKEVRAMISDHGKASGANATEIALLKQRVDAHDKWKLVWGGAILAGFVEFVSRKLGH